MQELGKAALRTSLAVILLPECTVCRWRTEERGSKGS